MSSLGTREKRILETLLQMSGGYLLDFSDRTIGEFFDDELGIDFFDEKYNINSGSKANRMRGFWKAADNCLVSESITKLCEYIETEITVGNFSREDFSRDLIAKAKDIASALNKLTNPNSIEENKFLQSDYETAKTELAKANTTISKVLIERIDEIRKCVDADASLAAVILAGSTIEGLLLDCAVANQSLFMASTKRPLKRGNTIPISEWTLDSLIKVAHDINILDKNVHDFSSEVRNLRNYIHPKKQASEGFSPDKRSANIALQVLLACIENIQKSKAERLIV